jgi:hypothetical protein
MLEITKARGGSGDTRALEDVQISRLNTSTIATSPIISQSVTGYVIGEKLLVLAVLRRENRHG